ncbi:MAG: DegT/DnrJ/EryC1/StrS family aminotransferase [Planctomycetes bacterium]|nr:DegT/DnrJ/EryC1/StrS family aminotransferase [Planctomycetota bacterium]MCB9919041.1 DegT/DnrJ/EryC1/StrS family aminotransferase [Planctomycetota bacterium]
MSTTAVTSVPLLDTTRGQEAVFARMREVFDSVLTSGRYILGPEVEALEAECAEYCGAAHSIGVSSGSDALLVALMALDVGPGDEVVLPTFTFFATAGAVSRLGAKPVFCDVDPRTFNVTAALLEPYIGPNTKALIPVHLFGQCCDMTEILDLAAQRGVPVIEDAAQAIGAEWRGRRAGSMGTMGCFSFYPTKNLGALGDAGLVTTGDADIAKRLAILRGHGMSPRYYHKEIGGNFRIDALQAALLRVRLPELDAAHQARRDNAALYRELFVDAELAANADGTPSDSGHLLTLPTVVDPSHIYNQFVVRVSDGRRDELRSWLSQNGVGTEIYYPLPLHMQECYRGLGYREGDFPVSEAAARETLALPIFPTLRRDEIEYVVRTVRAFSDQ